jgi:uncharacterized protein YlxW (UPF0749 family)
MTRLTLRNIQAARKRNERLAKQVETLQAESRDLASRVEILEVNARSVQKLAQKVQKIISAINANSSN